MIGLEFWVVVFVFSLGGHTDTYRSGCYDSGAFELCLPSLGILYQITQLRTQYLGSRRRLTWSWGEDRRTWTVLTRRNLLAYKRPPWCVWSCVGYLLSVFRRYEAYATRPTITM